LLNYLFISYQSENIKSFFLIDIKNRYCSPTLHSHKWQSFDRYEADGLWVKGVVTVNSI